MFKPRILMLLALIAAGAATRLIPHWWNFTAIGAICLFGGAYFKQKWAAFLVPLAAIAISDVILTAFVYGPMGLGVNWFKYVCFALTVMLGMLLRERVTVGRTAGVAVLATAMFFVLSNFQVWLTGDGITYPHTFAGLATCYIAAIPFALNMLWGNLFYCGVLFGAWELLERQLPVLAADPLGQVITVK
jgi:Family of unknown function (DUF6580)